MTTLVLVCLISVYSNAMLFTEEEELKKEMEEIDKFSKILQILLLFLNISLYIFTFIELFALIVLSFCGLIELNKNNFGFVRFGVLISVILSFTTDEYLVFNGVNMR